MAKGAIILGFIGLLIGAGGLGIGAYCYIIFTEQIESLDMQIDDLEEELEDVTIIYNVTNVTVVNNTIVSETGKILQTKKVSSDTNTDITDATLTKTEMLDMNIQITTSGESYLAMRFFTTLLLSLFDGFSRTHFNVSIEFDGEEVCWSHITGSSNPPYGSGEDSAISHSVYLEYITDTLVAGTYTVRILWYSIYNEPGATTILTANSAGFPSVRTLIVQEIAS